MFNCLVSYPRQIHSGEHHPGPSPAVTRCKYCCINVCYIYYLPRPERSLLYNKPYADESLLLLALWPVNLYLYSLMTQIITRVAPFKGYSG
jgi:hypothetical protein